jgi:hypothetical protein
MRCELQCVFHCCISASKTHTRWLSAPELEDPVMAGSAYTVSSWVPSNYIDTLPVCIRDKCVWCLIVAA